MPRRRALAQAFRERLAGARGQSPRIKAQNQNAKQSLRAQQTPDQTGAAIKKLRAWTNNRPRSFYPRKIIAAPAVKQRQRL